MMRYTNNNNDTGSNTVTIQKTLDRLNAMPEKEKKRLGGLSIAIVAMLLATYWLFFSTYPTSSSSHDYSHVQSKNLATRNDDTAETNNKIGITPPEEEGEDDDARTAATSSTDDDDDDDVKSPSVKDEEEDDDDETRDKKETKTKTSDEEDASRIVRNDDDDDDGDTDDKEEEETSNSIVEKKTRTSEECATGSRRSEKPGLPGGVVVQYVHVPKAGGTTIQDQLDKWARARSIPIFMKNGDHEVNWKCPANAIKSGILMGHRGFGFCPRFMDSALGEKAFYIVALREPVSRFRSLFDYFISHRYTSFTKYHKRWDNRELSDIVVEYDALLKKGLPDDHPDMWGPLTMQGLARQQSAFMCGWDCVAHDQRNMTLNKMVNRAVANLQRTDVVVIMEKLDDLFDQLRFHVSWVPKNQKRFPTENIHKGKKSTLTAAATKIIAEWSKPDVALYQMAKTRHEELTSLARACGA